MMAQSVWHRSDLGRMIESIVAITLEANAGQSAAFRHGVMVSMTALAHAVGAQVRLPEPMAGPPIIVEVCYDEE